MKNEFETQKFFLFPRHFFSLSRSYNQASIAFIDFRTVFSFCFACLFWRSEKKEKEIFEWQSFSCHSLAKNILLYRRHWCLASSASFHGCLYVILHIHMWLMIKFGMKGLGKKLVLSFYWTLSVTWYFTFLLKILLGQ